MIGLLNMIVDKVFRYSQSQNLFCYNIFIVCVIKLNNMSAFVYFC